MTPVDKGWFFSIAVNQGGAKSSISCPLSDAELRLVKTLVTVRLGARGGWAGAGLRDGLKYVYTDASSPCRQPPPTRLVTNHSTALQLTPSFTPCSSSCRACWALTSTLREHRWCWRAAERQQAGRREAHPSDAAMGSRLHHA